MTSFLPLSMERRNVLQELGEWLFLMHDVEHEDLNAWTLTAWLTKQISSIKSIQNAIHVTRRQPSQDATKSCIISEQKVGTLCIAAPGDRTEASELERVRRKEGITDNGSICMVIPCRVQKHVNFCHLGSYLIMVILEGRGLDSGWGIRTTVGNIP